MYGLFKILATLLVAVLLTYYSIDLYVLIKKLHNKKEN